MTNRAGQRGAVLVEFALAFLPLLILFFTTAQLAKMATARLAVKHSAIVGARAAAVLSNVNDNVPDQKQGSQQNEIDNAVKAALGPWWQLEGPIMTVKVTVTDSSTRDDPYNWVEVNVKAQYACRLPFGFLVCGGLTKELKENYRMPHQGAQYRLDEQP